MLQALMLLAMVDGAPPPPLTAPQIVDRMVKADDERLAALAGFTGMRRYRFENKKHKKQAEMTLRMTRDTTGVKTFDVADESGSGFARNRVLRKMIEAEEEASRKTENQYTRIIPANYEFRLIGTETLEGRGSYVLEINPKTQNKFLIRGRIWVDAADFAIARVEGEPARNPSFWIRSVHVVQQYRPEGPFWLPLRNESRAQARIFGATEVVIEYFDYVTQGRGLQARGERAAERNR